MVGECTDERVVLHEKVRKSAKGRMATGKGYVWTSAVL